MWRWLQKLTRIYSGATKREVLKQTFHPFTQGTDPQLLGAHPSYLINGVADSAYGEAVIPPSYTSITAAYLVVVPAAPAASMKIDFATDYGNPGEQYNARGSGVSNEPFAAVANQVTWVDVSAVFQAAGIYNVQINDSIGFRVFYSAAVTATNVYALGILIRWG